MLCSASPASNTSEAVMILPQSQQNQSLPTAPVSNNNQESQPGNGEPLSLKQSNSPVPSLEPAGDSKDEATQIAGRDGWGNGGTTWGSGWENASAKWVREDFEETERDWLTKCKAQSPKLTSLNIKESSWGHDTSRFVWRSSQDHPTDRHVTHATRGDLGDILLPTGPERPSALDNVPTNKWARIQLIRSLREAQESHIPGPNFTLLQVASCLVPIQTELSVVRSIMSQGEEEIKKIRDRQAKLDAEVRQLDDKVQAIRDANLEVEAAVKRLVEVEMDLKDLESIVLAYCQ
ncbi:hypothetical protein AAF712_014813 [Marasmius tenuissimus]|uniref:Uncharacterized protein n=1 Tax=Marasmius tenuissimus TaxID=585030 RepID=A0ABR2ZA97_9AGAR